MDSHHDSFVAVIAILVIFGLPLAYALTSRWYAHQERMAMIARGIAPGAEPRTATRTAGPDPQNEWQANRSLGKGIRLTMLGFALIIGLSFIRLGTPGPWLLGGLIPFFVGIGQIIIALLSGARLGPFTLNGSSTRPQAGTGPFGQSGPPFGTPPRDVTPGPYAWRPGSTTELEKPPSPPDKR